MGAKTSLFLLAALCLVLGIARSERALPTSAGGKSVEINFWNGFTGPDGRVMLEIVRRFNEEHVGQAHVTMQRIAWATYYNKVMVSALNARGPDVFVLQAQSLSRKDRAGIVDSVDDVFDSDPKLLADFDESLLDRVNFGTRGQPRRIGVPLDIWPHGLYYNAEMLKSVGLTNPDGTARAPQTRDEFLRAADQLKHDGQWGFAFGNWAYNFMTLVPQFGGRLVDDAGNPTLDDPGNVAALQFLADLLLKYHVAPPPEGGVAGWTGFRQQRVAMVFDGIYMLGDLKRLDDRLDNPFYRAAPIPQLGSKPGTMADSHVLCIRKGLTSDHRDAAKTFVRYVSDHSIDWANAGQVPARRSARESDAFKKLTAQYEFSRQLPYVMYPPRTPSFSELQNAINLAVEKAIRGRASAADALRAAQEDYTRYLERDRMEREFTAHQEVAP